MEHLVDSLGYLLKGYGPAYLNVFDTVTAPVFGPLLDNSQPASLRWASSQQNSAVGQVLTTALEWTPPFSRTLSWSASAQLPSRSSGGTVGPSLPHTDLTFCAYALGQVECCVCF